MREGWESTRAWRRATWVILGLTVAQLAAAATFAGSLPQFQGKGFGARLLAYPALMLLLPFGWWLARCRRPEPAAYPWAGFALVMAPFLLDVTGNSLDLYDTITWWDDANHLVNWFLLSTGIGILLLRARIRPLWATGALVAGIGALLAIGWELGEWWTFIRHGTELDTAYTDTLGDETLGSLGAVLAGVLTVRLARAAGEEQTGR